jgi:hypothetical protein
MPCTVVQFLVDVKRHPKPEDRTGLHQWLIRIHVKFKSDNPNKWGELRACGGYWVRRRDGKSPTCNWTYDDQLNLTKEERYPDWKGESPDLFGGESPDTKDKRNWRIGNDQHIEIFYAKVVPGVPRSNPLVNATTADDDNSPDNIMMAQRPLEVDLRKWHIVGRDEPGVSGTKKGEYVEYIHQAVYSIREPQTSEILASRRLYCKVQGVHPYYEYRYHVDVLTRGWVHIW